MDAQGEQSGEKNGNSEICNQGSTAFRVQLSIHVPHWSSINPHTETFERANNQFKNGKYSMEKQTRTEMLLKLTAGKEREHPGSPETFQAFESSP